MHRKGAPIVVQVEWRAVYDVLLRIVGPKKSSSRSDRVWRCCSVYLDRLRGLKRRSSRTTR